MSIESPRYAIKVISSHRARVDVGTPRFRLQYSRADKRFGSEHAAAVSTTFRYRATRKTIFRRVLNHFGQEEQ